MKLPPARWSPAALTELLTVKKQCKRIFHGNEWMKEHNYAFQNADTRPGLQSRTQNICFVISISAVILKRMVKITSIFGSYSFLRIALHDIFSLSHHLLASWNLYIPRVAESQSKCSSGFAKSRPAVRRPSPDFPQLFLSSGKSTRMHRSASGLGVQNGRRWVWIRLPF